MLEDAVLDTDKGYYDFSLNAEGQIVVDNFFDTALLYSVLGERRADGSEIPETSNRRGWIGSENADYENGSKLWTKNQSRVSRGLLNDLQDIALDALEWLVDDKLAIKIENPVAIADGTSVTLDVTIRRTAAQVVQRSFILWNNTGVR